MSRTRKRQEPYQYRHPKGHKKAKIHNLRSIPPNPYEDIHPDDQCFIVYKIIRKMFNAGIEYEVIERRLRHEYKIPAWQWYVAVHGTGFIWVVFLNNVMFGKNILLPSILSTVFFSMGETLNWFVFQFFIYTDEPFGKIGAFISIQGMYFIYCIVQCFLLRLSDNTR